MTKIFSNNAHFHNKNPIVFGFLIVGVFAVVFALFKIISQQPHTLYARVKVSQGLWWANTSKPTSWMVNAVKKGDVEKNLGGRPIIEVLEVRSYPWWDTEQFDIYLVLKLEADYNERREQYMFKRSNISVGAPIDMVLNNVTLTGTVMETSPEPFKDIYAEKEIILSATKLDKRISDTIEVGDSFSDGVETVFEIVEVEKKPSYLLNSSVGNNYPIEAVEYEDVTLRARIKVRNQNGIYMYRQEIPLSIGKSINIVADTTVLTNFTITEIM